MPIGDHNQASIKLFDTGAGFTSEPHDTEACEGDSIRFPCVFMGSSQYPSWAINGILYPRDYVPEQYDVHFLHIHIPFVSIKMSRNSYQCFVAGFESNTAILHVCKYPFIDYVYTG